MYDLGEEKEKDGERATGDSLRPAVTKPRIT